MDTAINNLSKLTFTRFIAALMVVAFHFGANIPPFDGDIISRAFRQGPYAVQYFFFLSGFIMATVYATDSPSRFDKRTFWIARFARIYPVYLLGLALAAFLVSPDFLTLLLNVTLLQAWSAPHALSMNNPGWSLSVEVFFYAAFPAFLMVLTKNKIKLASAVAIALCLLHECLNIYLSNAFESNLPVNPIIEAMGPYFPPLSLPFFFAGCVLAVLAKNDQLPRLVRVASSSVMLAAVAVVAWLYFRLPLIVIPFGLLILSLTRGNVPSILSSRLAIFLGESSYALYILHFPLYLLYLTYIAPKLQTDKTTELYIYICLLIATSCITFVAIEKPCRRYLRAASRKDKMATAN